MRWIRSRGESSISIDEERVSAWRKGHLCVCVVFDTGQGINCFGLSEIARYMIY
jgi:hypothetical protein